MKVVVLCADVQSCPSIRDEVSSSPSKMKLSPWEKWLVTKTRQQRNSYLKKMTESQEARENNLKMQAEKDKRQQLMDARFKAWLSAKESELKRKEMNLRRRAEVKLKNELEKRLEIKEKSKNAYTHWLQNKIKADKERASQLKLEKNEAEMEIESLKQTNEEAYSNYLRKTACFSPVEYRSYGFTCGKLISWKC